jgi:hypothetical protein
MSVESVFSNLALSFVLKEAKEFALPLIFMSNASKIIGHVQTVYII